MTVVLSALLILTTHALAAPIPQVGLEVGALTLYASEDSPLRYGGTPILATGGLLVPTGNGWLVRPHLAAGMKVPDGSFLVREGVFVGKKLGDHLVTGAGGVFIQVVTPDGIVLNPGGNLAVAFPYPWGVPYVGVGITRLGVIPSAGLSINL